MRKFAYVSISLQKCVISSESKPKETLTKT